MFGNKGFLAFYYIVECYSCGEQLSATQGPRNTIRIETEHECNGDGYGNKKVDKSKDTDHGQGGTGFGPNSFIW